MAWQNADRIAPKEGGYEPQKQFAFSVSFTNLDSSVELAVQSANLPVITNEPIEVPFMNETRRVAGKIMVEAGELTIRDYVDPDIAAKVEDWRGMVSDVKAGKIFYASAYKCDGTLQCYDGEGGVTKQWRLVGCWPSNVNFGQLDYSTSDQVQITMTVQYDKAYMDT